jgi:exonuclease SbcC
MTIQYIFHSSDYHIIEKNFNNLKNSFKILVNDIKHKGINKSLLIIAGDIFENKTFLRTDEIFVFQMLCNLLHKENIKTLITIGNHDIAINNSSLIRDNISLLNRHENIKVFNETTILNGEIFGDNSLDFYIFSPLDRKIPEMQNNNKTKIAILHEPINAALFDNGELISNARFATKDLEHFDYVMLGDIHKPQFLSKRIAYPGSFVQKNKGEGINHGYILWDLKLGTGEHVFIPLLEVYLKVEANNNNIINSTSNDDIYTPLENQKIRYVSLFHKDCTTDFIESLKEKMVNKYSYINRIIDNTKVKEEEKTNENNTIFTHNDIIKSLLKGNANTNKILEHHSITLQNRNEVNYTTYKLNYLFWNNIFCYGENNYINFNEFKNNLVMLNGHNKDGKSSIIDILIRILFNECTRGYKEDIVNKSKSKGSIKVSFNINNDEFIIEQIFHRLSKAQHHRLYKNGENITQDTIPNTYKYLRNVIGLGDYTDFVNMTTALQNRKYLVDLTQKDFISLLTKITNVDILKDVEDKTKKDINLLVSMNKKYNEEIKNLPETTEENVKQLHDEIKSLISFRSEIQININMINKKLIELNKDYNNISIPKSLEDIIINQQRIYNISKSKDIFKSYQENAENNLKDEQEKLKKLISQNYILLHKINSVSKKDLERIISTDYNDYSVDDRNKLAEDIRNLQDNCYKPRNDISYDKLQSFIYLGLSNDEINPLEKCEIESLQDIDQSVLDEIPTVIEKRTNELRLNIQNDLEDLKITRIDKPEYIDNLSIYETIIKKGLPDYAQMELEIEELSAKISSFNTNFGSLSFCDDCKHCIKNKKIIGKINVNNETKKLESLKATIFKKDKQINNYNNVEKRVARIHMYNKYLTERVKVDKFLQNEKYKKELQELEIKAIKIKENNLKIKQNNIFINNQKIKLKNDIIFKQNDNYNLAIIEIENKNKWDKLQSLNDKMKVMDEKDIKNAKAEYVDNEKIIKFINLCIDLKSNLQLLKIKQSNQVKMNEINKLNKTELLTQSELADINIEISDKTENYRIHKSQYDNRVKYLSKHNENTDKIQFLELYHSVINHRSGIPSYVLKNTCLLIKNNCNEILKRITDFMIDIECEKEIKIYTIENDIRIPASLGSGMQKFVLDMIMRVTLTKISNISNPRMLILDEGFGSLDAENFINVANILQKLKYNFDSLIIISHIAELKSYVDKTINIKKNKNLSEVTYGKLTDDQKMIKLTSENTSENKKTKKYIETVKGNKEKKEDKNQKIKESIDQYIQENGTWETILFKVDNDNIECLGCNKKFKNKNNFIETHLSAVTYKVKHNKYILKKIEELN